MVDKHFLITSNLEKKYILLSIWDQLNEQTIRHIREDIVPLLELFDEPVSLIIDLRETYGSQLDAIDALRELWSQYEKTTIRQIIRIFANQMDDHGTKITDIFHLKGVRKHSVTRMKDAIRYCEDLSVVA
ncbi:hypothetical protein [Cerasicoccus arenae]|uniref:Uncharacterized protein n=1 Tax=Cerasicoccus arenae TaxID=424488 RepID=A0A8J3DCB7_9BACT|nr:hypothetical protein [Cerasicoccus arenae]MBK1858406.1 hypothetical protein [Cerasicoccus arenae]GHC02337.1 hypothetical protein GCM10007047_18610 [Cerasicoccus arenae]